MRSGNYLRGHPENKGGILKMDFEIMLTFVGGIGCLMVLSGIIKMFWHQITKDDHIEE